MKVCIFETIDKKNFKKLKIHFKIPLRDEIYRHNIIHKCKKKKNIFLHGNFPNYYYERYKKKKIKVEEEKDDILKDKESNNNNVNHSIENKCIQNKNIIDDYRLAQIDNLMKDIFKNKYILDIGCNSGVTTFLLSLKYKCKIVNGIDIDCTLINNNVYLLKLFIEFILVYNKQSHILHFFLNSKNLLQIQKNIFLDLYYLYENLQEKIENKNEIEYKDESSNEKCRLFHDDGNLLGSVQEYQFPLNIYFLCSNIFDKKFNELENKYDVIICFSVLKWIHLNYGDAHIIMFFDLMHKILKKNGYFILEYHKEIKYKIKKEEKAFYKHKINLNYMHFDDIANGAYNNSSKMKLIHRINFNVQEEKFQKKNKRKKLGMFNRSISIYQKI